MKPTTTKIITEQPMNPTSSSQPAPKLPQTVQLLCAFGPHQQAFARACERLDPELHPAALPVNNMPLLLRHLEYLKAAGVKNVYLVNPPGHGPLKGIDLFFYREHMQIAEVDRLQEDVYLVSWTVADPPGKPQGLRTLADYFHYNLRHWQKESGLHLIEASGQVKQGVRCRLHRKSYCSQSSLGDRVRLAWGSRVVGSLLGSDTSVGAGSHVVGCVVLPGVALGAHLELVGKLVSYRGVYDPVKDVWTPMENPWLRKRV